MLQHPAWASLRITIWHQSQKLIVLQLDLISISLSCINRRNLLFLLNFWCVWIENQLWAILKSRTECLLSFFCKSFLGACIYYNDIQVRNVLNPLKIIKNTITSLQNKIMPFNTKLIFLFGFIWSNYFEKAKLLKLRQKLWMNKCETPLKTCCGGYLPQIST